MTDQPTPETDPSSSDKGAVRGRPAANCSRLPETPETDACRGLFGPGAAKTDLVLAELPERLERERNEAWHDVECYRKLAVDCVTDLRTLQEAVRKIASLSQPSDPISLLNAIEDAERLLPENAQG